VNPDLLTESDSVLVTNWLSFQQISQTLDIPLADLRALNPQFRKDVIPFNPEGYYIRLPKDKSKMFGLLRDSVYRPVNPSEIPPLTVMQVPAPDTGMAETPASTEVQSSTTPTKKQIEATPKFDKKRLHYVVKKGDKLNDIADWFDVTPFEIKSWNKLGANSIKSGQKLVIWVKSNKTGYYKNINAMSPKQKKKLKSKD
jgi:membrane-bound lytic murein transglycosylase D